MPKKSTKVRKINSEDSKDISVLREKHLEVPQVKPFPVQRYSSKTKGSKSNG